MDPTQNRKAHEALMYEANREAKYISNIHSVWIEPLYYEWGQIYPNIRKDTSQTFNMKSGITIIRGLLQQMENPLPALHISTQT